MHDDDKEYYRRRMSAELDAASCATNAAARLIHLEIAKRYADLIEDQITDIDVVRISPAIQSVDLLKIYPAL